MALGVLALFWIEKDSLKKVIKSISSGGATSLSGSFLRGSWTLDNNSRCCYRRSFDKQEEYSHTYYVRKG